MMAMAMTIDFHGGGIGDARELLCSRVLRLNRVMMTMMTMNIMMMYHFYSSFVFRLSLEKP